MKITPGPWKCFKDTRHGPQGNPWAYQWIIESDSRKFMAVLEVPVLATTVDHKQRVLAEHQQTMAEVQANARAIAALPDCLEALKLAAALDPYSNEGVRAVTKTALAALKKAGYV